MIEIERRAVVALALGLACGSAFAQIVRPTNYGSGADAEVRESSPTQNRGASTEIATRVRDTVPAGDATDGNDRNSVIYLQFDLTNLGPITTNNSTLRLFYRNNNLSEARISDTDGIAPDYGSAGFEFYGIPGATFNEATITYLNAPGITVDGDVGTKDFNASAMLLGEQDLPAIGSRNWLPVGGAFDFSSAGLDSFLASELMTNPSGVAVIAMVHRHTGLSGAAGGPKSGDEPANWINFNYLFNPKEQTTLNNDPNYDFDINDPNNPLGSPWSGADNSTGAFSPQLILIPTPSAGAVMALGSLAMLRRRR